jgi:hypothetical protein
MMSYTASAAWSRLVSSPCSTEHGQRRSAILSGRISTVAMSRSGMSACLASTSVTHNRALKTYDPSHVPVAARHLFIPMVHSPLGAVGYVAAPELFSRGGRAWSHGTHDSAKAHLGKEARSGAKEHVAVSELSSRGGEARGHMAALEPTSIGRRDPEMRNT